MPTANLEYSYSEGSRVLKKVVHQGGSEEYALEIFDTLRVNNAKFGTNAKDYQVPLHGETAYLAGMGRLIYEPTFPSPGKNSRHLLLELGDHLGSTSSVIDTQSGELVEKATYSPLGSVESDYRPGRWNNFREEYKFTGKEEDVELGIEYFGFRYFHPLLGRWLSPDPMVIHSLRGDPNPYAYVDGRLLNARDRFGLADDDVTAGNDGSSASDPQAGSGDETVITVHGTRPAWRSHKDQNWDSAWDGMKHEVGQTLQGMFRLVNPLGSLGPQISLGWANKKPPTSSDPLRNYELRDNFEAGESFIRTIAFATSFVDFGGIVASGAAAVGKSPALIGAGVGGGEWIGFSKQWASQASGSPATREMALIIANAAPYPMNFRRTIALLETLENVTLVGAGASDISEAQIVLARQLGYTPVPPMPGFDAEPTVIFGAGELGLTPTTGATTNAICWHCAQVQIRPLGGIITSSRTFHF